jgi:hypothetical protein
MGGMPSDLAPTESGLECTIPVNGEPGAPVLTGLEMTAAAVFPLPISMPDASGGVTTAVWLEADWKLCPRRSGCGRGFAPALPLDPDPLLPVAVVLARKGSMPEELRDSSDGGRVRDLDLAGGDIPDPEGER